MLIMVDALTTSPTTRRVHVVMLHASRSRRRTAFASILRVGAVSSFTVHGNK